MIQDYKANLSLTKPESLNKMDKLKEKENDKNLKDEINELNLEINSRKLIIKNLNSIKKDNFLLEIDKFLQDLNLNKKENTIVKINLLAMLRTKFPNLCDLNLYNQLLIDFIEFE